ncbi:TPA: hypothetical protein SMR47_000504 [Pseudomonas putida]|nr:hypothetical protein [Pseudomonas putida]
MKGEGKKKHKKGHVPLPVETYVYGSVKEGVSSLTVHTDPVTGELYIDEIDPSTIRRQITHKRDGKDDKVRYSAPANDFSLSRTDFGDLKSRFDYLMAADTNTLKEIYQGYRVSACSIYIVKSPLKALGNEMAFEHHATYLILNTDHEAKSEPLGWHLAITQSLVPAFLKSCKIAMVVDSELGRHVDINAGREPYYKSFYLPSSLKFFYASSDLSATYANNIISLCDKAAGMVLDEFKRIGVEEILKHTPIKLGTASCYRVVSRDDP